MRRGLFITLEGADGSGKSTLARTLRRMLEKKGRKTLLTREPGGSPLAEKIREILLSRRSGKLDPRAELLLFEAARRQHLCETIEPALKAGKVVLCDRFLDSTTAYQGAGRRIAPSQVAWLNAFAVEKRMPDLTLVLDVDPALGLARAGRLKGRRDRMEMAGGAFHSRVRASFKRIAAAHPRRIKWIEVGDKDAGQVAREAFAWVLRAWKRRP